MRSTSRWVSLGLVVLAVPASAGGAPRLSRDWTYSPSQLERRIRAVEGWREAPAQREEGRVEAEIIAQAKRSMPPAWATKGAWKEVVKGKEYLLGVGIVSGVRNQSLAITAAEDRARAQIAMAIGSAARRTQTSTGMTTTRVSSHTLKGVVVIDWYRSPEGDFLALAVKPP